MKKSFKSQVGVTLLEIMLVLAIAAMVIVMSIRYYQSASLNQKIASTASNVTGIVAAAESYLTAVGTFSAMGSSAVSPYLPGNTMPSSAWGGKMTISASGDNGYIITIPNVPALGCTQLVNLIKQNSKMTPSTCPTDAAANLTITVTA